MEKKILIIGNGSHHHTINFTDALKKAKPNYRIDIFDFPPLIKNKGEISQNIYNNVFPSYKNNFLTRTRIIRRIFLKHFFLKELIKLNNYDVIIIHYISQFLFPFLKQFRLKTNRLIGVVWGSDFLRLKDEEKRKVYIYYDNFDKIITDSPQLSHDLKIQYTSLASKIHTCFFGVMPIETLRFFKENDTKKSDSKRFIGLSPERLIISVGHNGSPAQQHIKVIKSIKNDPSFEKYKNTIQFIFPLTYGANNKYIEDIKIALNEFPYSYKIISAFLNNEETAHLRNSTDILIHVQTSDAFSGSMKEIFYSGGIVINGEWLKYSFLIEKGIYFKTIKNINEIPKCLAYCINNLNNEFILAKNNEEAVYELSSWSKVINSWIHLID